MKNHPTDLIGEMADELLRQGKWAEDGHYLCGESRQGDVTLRLYVSVHCEDYGSPIGDAMADIIVDGYEPVSTRCYDVMYTDDADLEPLVFDIEARDVLFNDIDMLLANDWNFTPRKKEVC